MVMVTYLLSRAEGTAVVLATLGHVVSDSLYRAVCWAYPRLLFYSPCFLVREGDDLAISASPVNDLKGYFDGEEVFRWGMWGELSS